MYITAFIVFVAIVILYSVGKSDHLKTLKRQYEQALRGIDKRAALDAGRAYYSYMRNGKALTIYDEQAITNDLSTMPVAQ